MAAAKPPDPRRPHHWADDLISSRVGSFLLNHYTRYGLAWGAALVTAGIVFCCSWLSMNDSNRMDGNYGHATIDFGGQYLMGRMLRRGFGQHLYHRSFQRQVLAEVYPPEDRFAPDDQHPNGIMDREALMGWFMGRDDPGPANSVAVLMQPVGAADELGCLLTLEKVLPEAEPDGVVRAGRILAPLAAPDPLAALTYFPRVREVWDPALARQIFPPEPPAVGGPLYPPINAFFTYPLSFMNPRTAYRASQVVNLLLAFVVGLAAARIVNGRIWWPIATILVLIFPGFAGSINLGQNATLTLAILVWGWALIADGRPGWGGFLWGFLAFKPVWATAFFLVPLLSGRWRVCLTMLASGAGLAALTLPIVGLQSWLDWLTVGQIATEIYKADDNWIHLARDLLTLPRRTLDFSNNASWEARLHDFPTTVIGWALLVAVFEVTVRLGVLRREVVRQTTGAGPAFLFLGAWLTCFHFMYYDALLAYLPVVLLFAEPFRFLEPHFLAVVAVGEDRLGSGLSAYFRYEPARSYPPLPPPLHAGYRHIWLLNRVEPTVLLALLILNAAVTLRQPPYDTLCVLILWLWSGWLCRRPAEASALEPLAVSSASSRDGVAGAAQLVQTSADVGRAHERLPHQHGPDAGFLQS